MVVHKNPDDVYEPEWPLTPEQRYYADIEAGVLIASAWSVLTHDCKFGLADTVDRYGDRWFRKDNVWEQRKSTVEQFTGWHSRLYREDGIRTGSAVPALRAGFESLPMCSGDGMSPRDAQEFLARARARLHLSGDRRAADELKALGYQLGNGDDWESISDMALARLWNACYKPHLNR